jgi:hypothetical protein
MIDCIKGLRTEDLKFVNLPLSRARDGVRSRYRDVSRVREGSR